MEYSAYTNTFVHEGQQYPIFVDYDTIHEYLCYVSDDKLREIMTGWDAIRVFNETKRKLIQKERETALAEVEAMFNNYGVETWRTNRRGEVIGEFPEFKVFYKAIHKQYPSLAPDYLRVLSMRVGNELFKSNVSPTNLLEMVKYARERKERSCREKLTANKMLDKCIQLASKYNVDPKDAQLVEKVREHDKMTWIKATHPNGTELAIDFCDGCSTWIVGEPRCECGSCRVYLDVIGDIDSWVAFPAQA